MELWFDIGLKPGFVLGWAGTNQFPILKPALLISGIRLKFYYYSTALLQLECFVAHWPLITNI